MLKPRQSEQKPGRLLQRERDFPPGFVRLENKKFPLKSFVPLQNWQQVTCKTCGEHSYWLEQHRYRYK